MNETSKPRSCVTAGRKTTNSILCFNAISVHVFSCIPKFLWHVLSCVDALDRKNNLGENMMRKTNQNKKFVAILFSGDKKFLL